MENFAFITQTDGSSGKVASVAARKVIRTQVMRTHWANKTGSGNARLHVSASASKKNKEKLPEAYERRLVLGQDKSHKTHSVSRSCSTLSRSSFSTTPSATLDVAQSPSRQLTRVTDDFVYAGSSIDLKSYGLFSHYSSEFHVIFCSPIQPFLLGIKSLCCSISVQEDSSALLHAICFTAAGHEAVAGNGGPNSVNILKTTPAALGTLQDALRHKSISISLLNRHLQQHPNVAIIESTILCVALHLIAEAISGDTTALTAHSSGLRRMVEVLGGLDLLSAGTATHVQLVDLKVAEVRQTCASFPLRLDLRHHFDSLSVQPYLLCNSSRTPLGSRFTSEPLHSQVSPALQRCLQYMRHLVSFLDNYEPGEQHQRTYKLDKFLALDHILLSLPYENSLSELDDCIRLALLLYLNIAMWKTPLHFAWVVSLVMATKAALLSLDWHLVAREEPDLFLWIFLVGRCAADGLQAQDEISWWTTQLRYAASMSDIWEWGQARRIVEGYFYIDRVCSRSWEAVWQMVVVGAIKEGSLLAQRHPCDHY